MTKSYPPFFTTSASCLATKKPSLGSAFIRIASSAPMAKAFLIVGSVCVPPTLATCTVAPCFSLNHMARVRPNSSFGLITN